MQTLTGSKELVRVGEWFIAKSALDETTAYIKDIVFILRVRCFLCSRISLVLSCINLCCPLKKFQGTKLKFSWIWIWNQQNSKTVLKLPLIIHYAVMYTSTDERIVLNACKTPFSLLLYTNILVASGALLLICNGNFSKFYKFWTNNS